MSGYCLGMKREKWQTTAMTKKNDRKNEEKQWYPNDCGRGIFQ
jgi:hypothetical protein